MTVVVAPVDPPPPRPPHLSFFVVVCDIFQFDRDGSSYEHDWIVQVREIGPDHFGWNLECGRNHVALWRENRHGHCTKTVLSAW
ncbi:MAG TPA: hypothetical protein VI997_11580 [Candidatus Thermoplasmatota archaeon]|nr:hypothetical protein [Candidatus Thermoplasmatota archaeon]